MSVSLSSRTQLLVLQGLAHSASSSCGPLITILTNHFVIINYFSWLALSHSTVYELPCRAVACKLRPQTQLHFQWCAWSACDSCLSWDFCGINSITPLWNDKRCQSCYPSKWSPRVPLLPDQQQLGLQVLPSPIGNPSSVWASVTTGYVVRPLQLPSKKSQCSHYVLSVHHIRSISQHLMLITSLVLD